MAFEHQGERASLAGPDPAARDPSVPGRSACSPTPVGREADTRSSDDGPGLTRTVSGCLRHRPLLD